MEISSVLFVGLGSIGQRHLRVLRSIIPNINVFALRSTKSAPTLEGVSNCFDISEVPKDIDFVVISNPSSLHIDTIKMCLPLEKPIFLEKPPLTSLEGADELIQELDSRGIPTYTAFSFRFHELILWAKEHIALDEVLEVSSYGGSYLPDWRKGTDYRECYSAKAELGGGVHLDLIHELDYIHFLFGLPNNVQGLQRKISNLEINSIDYAHYHLEYDRFFATVKLNYFRRDAKRVFEVVTKDHSLTFDLIAGKIWKNQTELIFESQKTIADTYVDQMHYFLKAMKSGKPIMNSLEESVKTLKLALSK